MEKEFINQQVRQGITSGFLPKNQTDWVTVTTIVHNIVRTLIQSGWFFSYPLLLSAFDELPLFPFLDKYKSKGQL